MTLKEDQAQDKAGVPDGDGALAPDARADVVTDPDGLRGPDIASARAYAKDGILGAPGSEVPGANTPVTRYPAGADHRDPRPATQVEGERLSAEADASAQMKAERESRAPGYAVTGLAAQDADGDDSGDARARPRSGAARAKGASAKAGDAKAGDAKADGAKAADSKADSKAGDADSKAGDAKADSKAGDAKADSKAGDAKADDAEAGSSDVRVRDSGTGEVRTGKVTGKDS